VRKSRNALTAASKAVNTIQAQSTGLAWWEPILAYGDDADSKEEILETLKPRSGNVFIKKELSVKHGQS
jgi:hypothetical protein